MSAGWIDGEPGIRAAGRELLRLYRRAILRWRVTATLTFLIVAAVVVRKAFQVARYPAQVALLAMEGEIEVETPSGEIQRVGSSASSARTEARLQDYVVNVVFSDAALLEIMRRHSINPSKVAQNPKLAVSGFRDDIDVDVYRNNFIYDRLAGDPPRSARLDIGVFAADPREALFIAQELADLVISHEARRRTEMLEAAKAFSAELAINFEQEVARREREVTERLVDAQNGGTMSPLELQQLQSLEALKQQLAEVKRERNDLSLRESMEEQDLGLKFERVDWRSVERPEPKQRRLLIAGFVTLLLVLPLIGLAVGAFDSRVYAPSDVRRLGMVSVGIIRAWPPQAALSGNSRSWTRIRPTPRA